MDRSLKDICVNVGDAIIYFMFDGKRIKICDNCKKTTHPELEYKVIIKRELSSW